MTRNASGCGRKTPQHDRAGVPDRRSITDPRAQDVLRAVGAVQVGKLTMTAAADGSSFTLTDPAGGSSTYRSVEEFDAAVAAARGAAPELPEPGWCVEHERLDASHPDDEGTVHRGRRVDVATAQHEFTVQVCRYDFTVPRLDLDLPAEDAMVMLDDEPLTPAEALALGEALVVAAGELAH